MNEFHEEIKYKYCKICKKVLCRNCERIHQNEYSEHILCNEFINDNCLCLSHNKNFSNFCNDCYINLCDDCLILHNKTNINHDIIKINEIDILTIEKIKLNICDVTESIKDCEEIIKSLECLKNKYKLFFKINLIKLLLLYKITFLKMYENNKLNYIVIQNLINNNIPIQEIRLNINEEGDKIYDIFTPYFNKSICCYEMYSKKLHVERINSVILLKLKYLITFSEDKIIKILDKNNFNIIKEINNEFDKPIYDAIQLRNENILVGYGNKMKIISINEKELTIKNEYEFPNFTEDQISTFIELFNNTILVLSNGKIISFKKTNNVYDIFKTNINYNETIYSIIELNKKKFLTTSNINGEKKCCHIQIWDSNKISVIHNSCEHFFIQKNKNNVCRYNKESVIFCLDMETNFRSLYYNFKKRFSLLINVNLNHLKIYKIFNNSFIGVTIFRNKYGINQYEFLINSEKIISNNIGFKTINSEINNIFIFEDKIIVLDINGNIIIYQNENENLKIIKDNKEINSNIKKLNEVKRKKERLNLNDIKNTWNRILEKGEKINECKDLTEIKKEYIVIETENNGNCLFDSLGKNEKISTAEMRSKIMEYLKDNYKKLEGFEENLTLENSNIESYIKNMEKNYQYGTYIEICAYSLLFEKHIITYIIDENNKGIGSYKINEQYSKKTYLLFIRHSKSENLNHYKLLKKKRIKE